MLKQKPELDETEQSLMLELEESIIKLSIQYIKIEDETIPFKDKLKRIKDIKKAISSIELPMKELPMDTIKDIFDVMVVADPKSYVLVIKIGDNMLDTEVYKNVLNIKSLIESTCKSKSKFNANINWKICLISV